MPPPPSLEGRVTLLAARGRCPGGAGQVLYGRHQDGKDHAAVGARSGGMHSHLNVPVLDPEVVQTRVDRVELLVRVDSAVEVHQQPVPRQISHEGPRLGPDVAARPRLPARVQAAHFHTRRHSHTGHPSDEGHGVRLSDLLRRVHRKSVWILTDWILNFGLVKLDFDFRISQHF